MFFTTENVAFVTISTASTLHDCWKKKLNKVRILNFDPNKKLKFNSIQDEIMF